MLGKFKLKKKVCNFSFEMPDNEKKDAYQELPCRFCVQYWRIKYTFSDVFISRLHERYLTHFIPTDSFEISL